VSTLSCALTTMQSIPGISHKYHFRNSELNKVVNRFLDGRK
jgi:hypothetical protein